VSVLAAIALMAANPYYVVAAIAGGGLVLMLVAEAVNAHGRPRPGFNAPGSSSDAAPSSVIGWVTALVAVLLGAAAVYPTLVLYYITCIGDNGEPPSPEAPVARFCESGLAGPYFFLQVALPVIVMVVLGVRASFARSWRLFGTGVGLACAVWVVMGLIVATLNA
jgi:hypothetical protein